MRPIVRVLVVPALVALASVGAACGSDDDPPASTTTSTTATTVASTTTTTTTTTTTAAPASTTTPTTTVSTTTPAAYQPGDPCDLGSDRDCIDPDGTGQGTYLIGGGDCMEGPYPDLCIDLDGDGYAGYPDRG